MALSSRSRCLLLLWLTAVQVGHAAVQVRALSFAPVHARTSFPAQGRFACSKLARPSYPSLWLRNLKIPQKCMSSIIRYISGCRLNSCQCFNCIMHEEVPEFFILFCPFIQLLSRLFCLDIGLADGLGSQPLLQKLWYIFLTKNNKWWYPDTIPLMFWHFLFAWGRYKEYNSE